MHLLFCNSFTFHNLHLFPVAAQQMSNEAALKAQNNDDEPFLQQYRTKDNVNCDNFLAFTWCVAFNTFFEIFF